MTPKTILSDLSRSLKTTALVLAGPYLVPMLCLTEILRAGHHGAAYVLTGFVFTGFVANAMFIGYLDAFDTPSLDSETMRGVIDFNARCMASVSCVLVLLLMMFSPTVAALTKGLNLTLNIPLFWTVMFFALLFAAQYGMARAFEAWGRALLKFERYRLEVQRYAARPPELGELPPITPCGAFSARTAFYETFA
jgi:hypothetical protein